MKIEVGKSELQNALSLLVPIANTKTPNQILNHLLFHVSNNTVYITSTDLEIGARTKIKADISEPGTFTLIANKVAEIVANMPNEAISFSSSDSVINIKSGNALFKLQSLEASDYPVFADLESSDTKRIASSEFLDVLNNVLYAASTDDSRFNFNSLYFTKYNESPCIAATDGHRLALQYVDELPFPEKTLLPVKGCEFIKKFLLKDTSEFLTVSSDHNNVMFSTEDTIISIRLIAGDYPDIARVIPVDNPKCILKVNTEDFKSCVKRVSLVNDQINRGILNRIIDNNIEFSANTSLGMANDVVNVDKDGENFDTLLNSSYLLDVLNVLKAPTCEVKFFGDSKPIIFTLPSENNSKFFSLLMPLRK